jgi:membrane protein DedA with SNARE-associated domain
VAHSRSREDESCDRRQTWDRTASFVLRRRHGDNVMRLGDLLALATSVLAATTVPFVPTGEMVSGAAALAANSWGRVLLIFGIGWVCSVLGDTVLMLEARVARGRLNGWLGRRKFGDRVKRAQLALTRNAFNAVLTARLIPGGRAPVIIALGVSRFPVRRFIAFDTAACALWAAVFATIGAVGGSLTDNPIWAMVIAIASAVSVGAVIQKLRQMLSRWRSPVAGSAAENTRDAYVLVGER